MTKKNMKISETKAGLRAKTGTQDLPNKKQEC
jgi:hypothetical protein